MACTHTHTRAHARTHTHTRTRAQVITMAAQRGMLLSPHYETMLGDPESGVESQLRQAAIVSRAIVSRAIASVAAAGGRGLPGTHPDPTSTSNPNAHPNAHPNPHPHPHPNPHPEQAAEGYLAATGRPLQLLFCVMPDRGSATYLYPAVKRWANTSGGVPSQCVQAGSEHSNPKPDPYPTPILNYP